MEVVRHVKKIVIEDGIIYRAFYKNGASTVHYRPNFYNEDADV